MQKGTKVLLRAPHLAATSRARCFIESIVRLSPRTGRDLILLFCFSWLATLLPLMPHQVPTLWLWGALSGVCLVTTSWLLCRLGRGRGAIRSLLGCSALICVGSLCDFWRLPPVYLLSQCRTPMEVAFPTMILRHIEFHCQWFPVTTMAMLLWICLGFQAFAEARAAAAFFAANAGSWKAILRCMQTQILPRLAYCLLMLFCMGLAMSAFESLGATAQQSLSADGLVCAMLCGMSLYHLVLNLYSHLLAHRTINFS